MNKNFANQKKLKVNTTSMQNFSFLVHSSYEQGEDANLLSISA